MRSDVLVYISGPLSAAHGRSVEQNVADALAVYLDLLKRNIPAFCPHLVAAFSSAHTAMAYDDWLDYDVVMLRRCTHVLMMERWRMSTGAKVEQAEAMATGLPVAESMASLLAMVAE